MSRGHIPSVSFDGSSMEHMENFNDGSIWANESQFDNATMFQDHNANAMDFSSMDQLGHDDCRPCNSPDCDQEPCPAGDQAYECLDPHCFPDQTDTMCHDASHGQCAGNAPPDIIDAAYHLYGLNGTNIPSNHIVHCDPNAHVHTGGMGTFDMHNHSMMGNNTNFFGGTTHMSSFNGNDFGSNFCNPNYCDFNTQQGFGDEYFGCYHFPEIGTDINELHAFHHHKQQWPNGICPQNQGHIAHSPIVQSASETGPSDTGNTPRRPTSTPITSSSNGSPNQATRKLQAKNLALLQTAMETEDDEVHTCQWLGPNDKPCGEHFFSAEGLQSHTCKVHINHLTKANPGFYCRWEGCERLSKEEQAPFAQKSKLERHMQKHTGCMLFGTSLM